MPISIGEFEKGTKKDPLEEEIVQFLEENKDKAFSDLEIAKKVVFKGKITGEDWLTNLVRVATWWFSFHGALDRLVKEGRIRKRNIERVDYYTL